MRARPKRCQRDLQFHLVRFSELVPATHLLNHAANLRVVQLLPGHANIPATQIFTHVARECLKQLRAAHHPLG